MSKHSIKKPAQLFVNGERVKTLGTKIRLSDMGIKINDLISAKERGENIEQFIGAEAIQRAKDKADARRKK